MPYANNKGADQLAHVHSLISTFVVRCLDSIIPTLAKSKISRPCLAPVAEKAGLRLTWSETPKTGFLVSRLIFTVLTHKCQPHQLEESIFNFRGFLCTFFILLHFLHECMLANSGDLDQTPHSAISDLGLHCLTRSHDHETLGFKGSELTRIWPCSKTIVYPLVSTH